MIFCWTSCFTTFSMGFGLGNWVMCLLYTSEVVVCVNDREMYPSLDLCNYILSRQNHVSEIHSKIWYIGSFLERWTFLGPNCFVISHNQYSSNIDRDQYLPNDSHNESLPNIILMLYLISITPNPTVLTYQHSYYSQLYISSQYSLPVSGQH